MVIAAGTKKRLTSRTAIYSYSVNKNIHLQVFCKVNILTNLAILHKNTCDGVLLIVKLKIYHKKGSISCVFL